MFDRIGILSEKVSTTGVIQENLELPLLPNSIDTNITQNNKMKFLTDPLFYSHEGELTQRVDEAKNVWLIDGQLPIETGILAEAINRTIFPSNTVVTSIVFNGSA